MPEFPSALDDLIEAATVDVAAVQTDQLATFDVKHGQREAVRRYRGHGRYWGQMVALIRSGDAVVVRLGLAFKRGPFDARKLLADVLSALPK